MSQLALGLDLGTSGARVVGVTPKGEVIAEAQRDYPLLTPRPGWTEQDPDDWRRAAMEVLRDVASQFGVGEVAALGLSGQMHGMVPLDGVGEVVRPAILWNDQRTGE
ncbi:MAG: FGGY family carbohydrate kinase, partial [bacterium]|nr:FGGY family carbohydrate kinase [bacterium]